jgi:hypothetical protein
MATTTETVNTRIEHLRNDALGFARAVLTHEGRKAKAAAALRSTAVDLETFAGSRKAVLTDEQRAFIAELVDLADADTLDTEALVLLLSTLKTAPEPKRKPEPVEDVPLPA